MFSNFYFIFVNYKPELTGSDHKGKQQHCNIDLRRLGSVDEAEREVKMKTMVVMMILMLVSKISAKEQLSTKECEDLGFTGLALCSDCHSLSEYVKDQELVSDCLKCCADDSEDSMSKVTYAGAILEVCMRKLVFYPEIVGFIEEEKEKFPSVKVQYIFNSPPKLIMLDEDGDQKETIRIDNWKREHLLQYMREKVKPTAAS